MGIRLVSGSRGFSAGVFLIFCDSIDRCVFPSGCGGRGDPRFRGESFRRGIFWGIRYMAGRLGGRLWCYSRGRRSDVFLGKRQRELV